MKSYWKSRENKFLICIFPALCCCYLFSASLSPAQNTRQSATYKRIKAYLDAIPAIDTHDHYPEFSRFQDFVETERGPGMNLAALFQRSYYLWLNPLPEWKPQQPFGEWWRQARDYFNDTRCATFYRYQLPAFRDLYGLNFDTITDEQAEELDRRIYENYKNPKWAYEVITERANIELMVIDPHWNPHAYTPSDPFCSMVQSVNQLLRAFHPAAVTEQKKNPYEVIKRDNITMNTLDDYLEFLDRFLQKRKAEGAVGLKCTVAYSRTLLFEKVPKDRAEKIFGRSPEKVAEREKKDFEDFIMWYLVGLSAKYDLPFQIHTGHARIQGSNPMLLVDMIAANPQTKFVLFHGGFPWIEDAGIIAMRYKNVWLDSCWLPTLSYSIAKRAYHEWLEMIPSTRILWGADSGSVETVYGSTVLTRECLAEVLAEKIDQGYLLEEHARHIGRQILRDNALELFPALKQKLWKHK